MADGSRISLFSLADLEQITGVTYKTIRKRLDTEGVEPAKRDGRTLYYEPRPALEAIYCTGPGALDRERTRLAKEQADAQELKNAESRGELVPASQVEAMWVRLFSAARIRLLAVPSKVAPLVVGLEREAEVEAIVREHQTEALQELAEARVVREPDPDDEE